MLSCVLHSPSIRILRTLSSLSFRSINAKYNYKINFKPNVQPVPTSLLLTHSLINRSIYTSVRYYSSQSNDEEEAKQQPKIASNEFEYRSSLRAFLLKVHPDFFAQSPKMQTENDRSLKQLNQLLDTVDEYFKQPSGPIQLDSNKIAQRINMRFYLKSKPKENKSDTSQSTGPITHKDASKPLPSDESKTKPKRTTSSFNDEFPVIESSIVFQPRYFEGPFEREALERDIRIFLNDLLRQSDLPTMPLPQNASNFDAESQFDEKGQYKPTPYQNEYAQAQVTRQQFSDLLEVFLNRHYPISQLAADKLGENWVHHLGESVEADIALGVHQLHKTSELQRKQLHYDPNLNGEERANALMICEELWFSGKIPNDIPIYILNADNEFLDPTELPGFITIPIRFDKETLETYLNTHLKTIMIARYNIRSQLFENEYLINSLKTLLKIPSFQILCPLDQAFVCLNSISQERHRLEKFYALISGMKWLIVSKDYDQMPPQSSIEVSNYLENDPDAFFNTPPGSVPITSDGIPSTTKKDEQTIPEIDPWLGTIADPTPKTEKDRKIAELFEMSNIKPTEEEIDLAKKLDPKTLDMLKPRPDHEFVGFVHDKLHPDERSTLDSEDIKEFADAVRNSLPNRSTVFSEDENKGVPAYSLTEDTLYIPSNTTGENLLRWLELNQAILSFRNRVYPSEGWRLKINRALFRINRILGSKRLGFRGTLVNNKFLQVQAINNLARLAPSIREIVSMDGMNILITEKTYLLNLKEKKLYLPFDITEDGFKSFLKSLRNKNTRTQTFQAEQSRQHREEMELRYATVAKKINRRQQQEEQQQQQQRQSKSSFQKL